MTETIRFYFDPLCPWAWQGARWIHAVTEVRSIAVDWRLFSLQIVNPRSLCYVDDLIEGLWRLINSNYVGPMNIGNPEEIKILELAQLIVSLTGSSSEPKFVEGPVDDPEVRCPDISLARRELDWEPKVSLLEGLERTIEWAKEAWRD